MNPIIRRELIGALRTRKALAVQVIFTASLAGLVIIRWPADAAVDLSLTQARQMLLVFGYGILTALILLAPVFPAASIARERSAGTLALLLNSPMSPWSILLGKLAGAVGFIALLLCLSMPAAAACFTMGGIELRQLLGVYALLFLVAVQYATLAMAISSHASTTDSALRMTYGTILVMSVLTLVPYQLRQGLDAGFIAWATAWVRALSPIAAMVEVLGQSGITSQGIAGQGDVATRYTLLACVTTLLSIMWTGMRLNRRILDRPRAAGAMTDDMDAYSRASRRFFYMWFFDPSRRTGMIGPLTNAVMVKEFRSRRFGRSRWVMRLIALTLVGSMGMVLLVTLSTLDWGPALLGTVVVLISCALVLLITPALAAGAIAAERETGSWQLLQLTPLSAVSILFGKIVSVLLPTALVLAATLPAYAVIVLIDRETLTTPVTHSLITLALMGLFVTLSSAAIGSFFRRAVAATVGAYIFTAALTAGTLLVWLGRGDLFSESAVERILRLNPVAAALQSIHAPGLETYRLIPDNWWIIGGGCVLSLLVLTLRTWQLTRPQ